MVKAKQTPRQSTRSRRGRSRHSLSLITTRSSSPTSSIRGRCPSPPSSCRSSPTSSTEGRCPSPSSCSGYPPSSSSAYDLGRQIETIYSGFDFGIPPPPPDLTSEFAKFKSFAADLGVTIPPDFDDAYVHKKLELKHKKEREMHARKLELQHKKEREMDERITAEIQRSCRAAAKELVREIKQRRMERKALVLGEHLKVKLKM